MVTPLAKYYLPDNAIYIRYSLRASIRNTNIFPETLALLFQIISTKIKPAITDCINCANLDGLIILDAKMRAFGIDN